MVHFNGIFHHKPSILGYPHLWKPPHGSKHQLDFVKSHILLPLSKRTTGFPPSKACFGAEWDPKDDGSSQGRWLSVLTCCGTKCGKKHQMMHVNVKPCLQSSNCRKSPQICSHLMAGCVYIYTYTHTFYVYVYIYICIIYIILYMYNIYIYICV